MLRADIPVVEMTTQDTTPNLWVKEHCSALVEKTANMKINHPFRVTRPSPPTGILPAVFGLDTCCKLRAQVSPGLLVKSIALCAYLHSRPCSSETDRQAPSLFCLTSINLRVRDQLPPPLKGSRNQLDCLQIAPITVNLDL